MGVIYSPLTPPPDPLRICIIVGKTEGIGLEPLEELRRFHFPLCRFGITPDFRLLFEPYRTHLLTGKENVVRSCHLSVRTRKTLWLREDVSDIENELSRIDIIELRH